MCLAWTPQSRTGPHSPVSIGAAAVCSVKGAGTVAAVRETEAAPTDATDRGASDANVVDAGDQTMPAISRAMLAVARAPARRTAKLMDPP